MNTPTIKNLRQQGYKVRVHHTRNHITKPTISGFKQILSNNGGETTIEITTPNMQYTASGTSVCSEKDNYNRRIGNSIALGRAWDKLQSLTSHV
jgi:hypothetical protein